MGKTAPLSVRLPETLNEQWQLTAIDEGIRSADAGDLAAYDEVIAWVRSWNRADELPPPKCG
jgi:predicted transcriptional regulator